jgi:hypothetical protein
VSRLLKLVAMTKAIEQQGARDIVKRAVETKEQEFRYATARGHAKRDPASEIRPSDILKSPWKVMRGSGEGVPSDAHCASLFLDNLSD